MSSAAFGNDTLTSNSMWQDVFVCKLINNYSVGINSLESPENIFKIYPNPTDNFIFIDLSKMNVDKETEICIYSITGNLVRKSIFQDNLITMNVEELVNGVYIITVNSNGSYERQKFVIQR